MFAFGYYNKNSRAGHMYLLPLMHVEPRGGSGEVAIVLKAMSDKDIK